MPLTGDITLVDEQERGPGAFHVAKASPETCAGDFGKTPLWLLYSPIALRGKKKNDKKKGLYPKLFNIPPLKEC